MRKELRKLRLSRETLRSLTNEGLRNAAGAGSGLWSIMATCKKICTVNTIDDTLESACYCPSVTDCSACPTCPF
jgi:hypothetical protein